MAEARHDARARYMSEDLDLRGIGVGALVIVVAIGCALLGAYAVVHLAHDRHTRPELAARVGAPPTIAGDVALQPRPEQDMQAYLAEKRRLIETYAWTDREHGVARIPIERAMELLPRLAAQSAEGAR